MDVQELMSRMAGGLSVGSAFGPAYEQDGTMVIPVALVAGGAGGGEERSSSASATDRAVDGPEGAPTALREGPSGTGSGAGGGFGGVVLPVGAYVVSDGRVRWLPAVNVNLIIVVSFAVLRLFIRSYRRRRRRTR